MNTTLIRVVQGVLLILKPQTTLLLLQEKMTKEIVVRFKEENTMMTLKDHVEGYFKVIDILKCLK